MRISKVYLANTLYGKAGREATGSAVSCSSMRKRTGNSSGGHYPQEGTACFRSHGSMGTVFISASRTARAK